MLKKRLYRPPPIPIDPLSVLMESVRLRCFVPQPSQMNAPWGVQFGGPIAEATLRRLSQLGLPPPPDENDGHRGDFIFVLQGSCWLTSDRQPQAMQLQQGDLALVPESRVTMLRDAPGTAVKHIFDIIQRENVVERRGLRINGGGQTTVFLHGMFHFEDADDTPILRSLPPVLHVRGQGVSGASWLGECVASLTREVERPSLGSEKIIAHVTQILFIQALRDHLERQSQEHGPHWLGAMRNPEISQAVKLIHANPAHAWTVASLADAVALSRSVFAAKFQQYIKQSPMQFLTQHRMRIARDLLRDSNLKIKAIAQRAGYATESAFSAAFKREMNQSPGAFRRQRVLVRAES